MLYTVTLTPETVGTHRRIQGMAWNGWPMHIQATLAEIHPREYAALLRRIEIDSETAKRVNVAYGRLSMRIARRCRESLRIRREALQRGFFPPLAWDDHDYEGHDLDDPLATPCLIPQGLRSNPEADELLIQSWFAGHPDARRVDLDKDKATRNELMYRLARNGDTISSLAKQFRLRSRNQAFTITTPHPDERLD